MADLHSPPHITQADQLWREIGELRRQLAATEAELGHERLHATADAISHEALTRELAEVTAQRDRRDPAPAWEVRDLRSSHRELAEENDGLREALADMRERAAKVAESHYMGSHLHPGTNLVVQGLQDYREAGKGIAAAIRALGEQP